jgi:lysophospholipase L1-like esterase
MRRVAMLVLFGLCLPLGHSTAVSASSSPPPPPASMAAIGDSITQAKNVCCWYTDHPANSWSTGTAWWDGVHSHYERLRAMRPGATARNVSVSGARMSDAPTQAQEAVAHGAEYVTIMLGANDLCTSSPDTMTSVDVFRAQFRQALEILHAGLPESAKVFVGSIPDVYQLWTIYRADWLAQFVWDVADVCPSLLSSSRSEEQRLAVRERNVAFNLVLTQECKAYAFCRFDENAVFAFPFERKHVSRLDFFHPSLLGAAELARVTWAQSWWN